MHVRKELSEIHYGKISDGFFVSTSCRGYRPCQVWPAISNEVAEGMLYRVTSKDSLSAIGRAIRFLPNMFSKVLKNART
jgi:hypothetical protein